MLVDILDYYKRMAMKFLHDSDNDSKDQRRKHRQIIYDEIKEWMNSPTICEYGFYPMHYACF